MTNLSKLHYPLTKIVFLVNDGKIEKRTYQDVLDEFRDETTTPRGIGPRYFAEENTVYNWSAAGKAREVSVHETQAQAETALYEIHQYDFEQHNDCPSVFETQEEAEKFLKELEKEMEGEDE